MYILVYAFLSMVSGFQMVRSAGNYHYDSSASVSASFPGTSLRILVSASRCPGLGS